jgi:hypothetical protein
MKLPLHRQLAPKKARFVSPYLPGGAPYQFDDPLAEDVAKWLKLEEEWTDYYVMGPLMAALTVPQLSEYSLVDALPWEILTPEVPGGPNVELVGAAGPPNLVWHPEKLPDDFRYAVTRHTEHLEVTSGYQTGYVGYNEIHNGDLVLTAGFDSIFPPVFFNLRTSSPVVTRFEIQLPPASYPYQWVADYAIRDESTIQLLNKMKLLGYFQSSPFALHKVGILATALIKTPKRVFVQ